MSECDGRLGRWKLRAVNDVAPMDQLGQELHVKTEFFAGNIRNQLRAGFIGGVVEFVAGPAGAEIFGIGRRQKCTLMVVKPPGDPRRTRILEIHNGVFAAVEHVFLERVRGAMRHTGKAKPGLAGSGSHVTLVSHAKPVTMYGAGPIVKRKARDPRVRWIYCKLDLL